MPKGFTAGLYQHYVKPLRTTDEIPAGCEEYELAHSFQRKKKDAPFYVPNTTCTPSHPYDDTFFALPEGSWYREMACRNYQCKRKVNPRPWAERHECAVLGYCCEFCIWQDNRVYNKLSKYDHTASCKERLRQEGQASEDALLERDFDYQVKELSLKRMINFKHKLNT